MYKKQENSRKIFFCFIDYAKALDCVDHMEGKAISPAWGNSLSFLWPFVKASHSLLSLSTTLSRITFQSLSIFKREGRHCPSFCKHALMEGITKLAWKR